MAKHSELVNDEGETSNSDTFRMSEWLSLLRRKLFPGARASSVRGDNSAAENEQSTLVTQPVLSLLRLPATKSIA